MEKIGSLDQAVKERDKSIMDLNQTIETMNKAEQHFHSQEVKNESEQAKYADRQMERKAEVQKQLVAAGNVRQRIPADTQRLLRESISEFNADAGNDSNLLIVFYVQIMPDDFVMQLHRF